MAWGSKTQIASGVSVAGTEQYSTAVTLDPGETAEVQITGDSNGTTDNLLVRVYATLDASSEQWDTAPRQSIEIDCLDGNLNAKTIKVRGYYKFRLGFIRSGSTDTITANAYYRKDGVSI